jgi:hypothetical protein
MSFVAKLPDEVASLQERLKALPLVDSADLGQPFAAYEAFDVVLSAILRAALVQAPRDGRRGKNAQLFTRFVRNHFPAKRGRGDDVYAKRLWGLRCDFAKSRETATFWLIHDAPTQHLERAADGRVTLDLGSLIADFRSAVNHLGAELAASAQMRAVVASELDARTVVISPTGASLTTSVTTVGAQALSGTN